MDLNINRNHNKANLNSLSFINNKIIIPLITSIYIFSGYANANVKAVENDNYFASSNLDDNDTNNSNNIEISIPKDYHYNLALMCGKSVDDPITANDLMKLKYLYLSYNDTSDLSWLKYCTNLDTLSVYVYCDDLTELKNIQYLSNLKYLSLHSFISSSSISFSNSNFDFVKNMSKLEELKIGNFNVQPGLIESFTSLKNLTLDFRYECDIDYSKLTFLDNLTFKSLPYSIVVSMSLDDYNSLTNSGVNISFDKEEHFDKFMYANKRLDKIVDSFNLDDNASDQEKLNAILIYVLDNLTYDSEVSETIKLGIDDSELTSSFYTDGALHAIFEKDSAICGNYAALVDALSKRLNIKSFVARSDNHAWNIVSVEGQNYYVDATWLDGIIIYETIVEEDKHGTTVSTVPSDKRPQDLIKSNEFDELSWYMEDPTKIDNIDQDNQHQIINLADYIIIRPIISKDNENLENNNDLINSEGINTSEYINESTFIVEMPKDTINDISDKNFEVSINNRTWIITGSVLVGLMLGLGSAVFIYKKKKIKEEKARLAKRRKDEEWNNYLNLVYGYTNSYDDYTDNINNRKK